MSAAQRQFFNTSLMASTRAMKAFKRAKQELPYKFQPTYQPAVKVGEDMEFHLPDESRGFDLKYLKRCPMCKSSYFHGPILDRVFNISKSTVPLYSVRCANPACQHSTPECESSKEAVQVWQVSALMMCGK